MKKPFAPVSLAGQRGKKPTSVKVSAGEEFVRFALGREALKLGKFKLKSGRSSSYFFDAGVFCDGESLLEVGRFYADAIIASGIEFDVLFGPAYKGIPLVSVTAACLARDHGWNKAVAYNRKEIKDHGEGGHLVGALLEGRRVLILDDVITAGTAIRESMELVGIAAGTVVGIVVCFDRKEKGADGEETSTIEVLRQYGIEVVSVADLNDLLKVSREAGIKFDPFNPVV